MDDFGSRPQKIPHYYGDNVRVLFVLAAVVMIAMLPFFSDRLPISTPASIFVIVILGLAAGFTSPRQTWILTLNVLISLVGTIGFGYFGVMEYQTYSFQGALFWINEGLAVVFLFSLYFSAKTLRGMTNV